MEKLILIKLGGSVITDKSKPFTAKKLVIKRLAREIDQARKRLGVIKIVIAHGGGSFPHTPAAKYKTHKGIINKDSLYGLSLTADAAVQINRIVVKKCLEVGLPVVSFAPASFIYAKNNQEKEIFIRPIQEALRVGLIPLVYGDVILDEIKGCSIFSAEKILGILALKLNKRFRITKIIQCSNTDGVYDQNGRTIDKITPKNFKQVKKWIEGSSLTDVTGGMLHKVEESLSLAKKYRISTIIVNGNKENNLYKALLERKVASTTIEN